MSSSYCYISQWFSKQADCFKYAEKQPTYTKTVVLARDHPSYPVAGVKHYACIVCHDTESIVDKIKAMGDAHLYELIRAEKPACAFMDIDFIIEDVESHEKVLRMAVKAYREFTGVKQARVVVSRCLRGDNPSKGSFHVLFPEVMFDYAHGGDDGQKKLMTAFRYWCSIRECYEELFVQGKFVVDTSVYSRNRVFRLPGNSKKGQKGATMEFVDVEDNGRCDSWLVQDPFVQLNETNRVIVDEVLGKWFVNKATPMVDTVDSYVLRKRTNKTVKYDLITSWTPLDVAEVTIRKDEDFMEYLSAAELKAVDWEAWFFPVMASLARSVDKTKLAYWCSTSKEGYLDKYVPLIDASVAMKTDVWVSGGVAMRVLKMKVKRVVDLRENCTGYVNRSATTIEATAADGWVAVDSRELYNRLANDLKRDNQPNTQASRRCFFITGKMGASKTSSILRYAEMQLRTGNIASVLYLCPRTVLCAQTANTVEEMHLEQLKDQYGRQKTKTIVSVRRFYTDSHKDTVNNDNDVEITRLSGAMKRNKKKVKHGYFDCCVVNSISKLPLEKYDMVIVDEPVVTVSNFYMDYEAHGGDKDALGNYSPLDYSQAYALMIRRANRVFFVDAAFTENVINLCNGMYLGGTRKATEVSIISTFGVVRVVEVIFVLNSTPEIIW